MDELTKFITPQNFAMVITIYLLVRFEKAFKALEEGLESKLDSIERAINKNCRLMALLVFKNKNGISDGNKSPEIQEILCIPKAEGDKEDLYG